MLPKVSIKRGDWHKPAPGFSFEVSHPVTVFLAVDRRGKPQLDEQWQLTKMELRWGKGHRDRVFQRKFPAGTIAVPANTTEHTKGSFGMPHTAFVLSTSPELTIKPQQKVSVLRPAAESAQASQPPVVITTQIDAQGTNQWTDFREYRVPHWRSPFHRPAE